MEYLENIPQSTVNFSRDSNLMVSEIRDCLRKHCKLFKLYNIYFMHRNIEKFWLNVEKSY
jgi:hypothetical protein